MTAVVVYNLGDSFDAADLVIANAEAPAAVVIDGVSPFSDFTIHPHTGVITFDGSNNALAAAVTGRVYAHRVLKVTATNGDVTYTAPDSGAGLDGGERSASVPLTVTPVEAVPELTSTAYTHDLGPGSISATISVVSAMVDVAVTPAETAAATGDETTPP